MKQKLYFFLSLMMLCIAGASPTWATDVTVKRSIDYVADGGTTDAVHQFTGYKDGTNDIITVTADETAGSLVGASNKTRNVTYNGKETKYSAAKVYRNKNAKGEDVINGSYDENCYVGIKLVIADGYRIDVSQLKAQVGVGDDSFKYKIVVTDGTHELYASQDKTAKKANANISTITIADPNKLVVAGTVYLRMYFTITNGGTSKYIQPFELSLKGDVATAPKYTITTIASPDGAGTVTGSGSYYENQDVFAKATANAGYAFENWTTGGNIVSTTASYSFKAGAADATYTANFKTASTHTITANVAEGQSDCGSIDKAGANNVSEGGSISLTATAKEGSLFVNWTKDGSVVSTDATLELTNIAEDATYVANFKKLYKVTYNLGTYAGTLTGKVLCNYNAANGINEIYADVNDKYTIPSYAHRYLYREGNILSGWTDGTNTYETGQEITLTSDITLTPTWTATTQTLATSNAETTVTWSFAKAQIVFMDWQSNDTYGYSTKPLTVNGESIAVPMKIMKGKVSNYTRTDAIAQTNQNTTFTIPAVKGMKVKIADAYKEFTATTIAGSTDYTGSGTKTIEYTYNGTDETIDIVIGESGQYLNTIAVTYPAIEQRQPSDLSLNLPSETVTLTAEASTLQLNPTSSATVALTYKSDNPLIASVDANGLITAVANGTTVITVSQKGDAVYQDDSKSVSVTVNNGVIPSYSVEMILNNETGSMLTSDEQVQGTQVSFGINASNERVDEDADDAVVVVSGKYWNDHGFNGVNVTVKATGNMKFTIGNCTYNNETATITNANNETVASASLSGTGCWKGSHSDVTVMYYEGETTTLTFTNPSYCPYIKVESVGEIEKYTVTFMNGNEQVEQKQVIIGEGVGTLPTLQVGDDKMFLGWYADTNDMGSKVSASTVPAGNVTYNAVVVSQPTAIAGYIVPESAAELVGAIQYANENSSANNPVKIFLKNGTYDLGSIAETFQMTSSYVSLIGESLDGTIITNVPTQEGLGTATLLYNKGQYNYLQDLTLWNNYPYGNSTGRAASLKDEGNYTICNNVWLYSHQDTYYSHSSGASFYFKGGKISGCIDYMCGQSRVYYDGVTLSNDNRGTTMTANSELYVFNNCVIENGGSEYNFGRAWSSVNNGPVCVFLNTTLKDNGSKLISTRWNASNMNTTYVQGTGEYGTKNASGTDITPSSNTVQFTYRENNQTKNGNKFNTILTADEAATYTMEYTLGDWAATAASDVVQATVENVTLSGKTLSWESEATAFLIEKDGAFVALTEEKTYDVTNAGRGIFTVRAANARGGFGEATEMAGAGTLTWNIKTNVTTAPALSSKASTFTEILPTDMGATFATSTDTSNKENLTVKIACSEDTPGATLTFNVPEGYGFVPYIISTKLQPVDGEGSKAKILINGANEKTVTLKKGEIRTFNYRPSNMQLTGTVTIDIYCYADGTTYRFGTPVTVTGQLVELPAQSVTVSISNAGWATLYTDNALDFSQVEGLTAYTATVSDNTVTLTEATEIGSDAGVVLHGEAGEYDIPVLDVEPNTAKGQLTGNATEATAYNEFANYQKTIYILASVNDGKDVQFVPCTSGSVAAKKAFLVLDTPTQAAKAMKVVFASETTGISNVNVNVPVPVKRIQDGQLIIEKNGKTYNAAGQLK